MGNFLQVLPLELRRQIYRELLFAKHGIAPPGARLKICPGQSVITNQLHPAILRANKQIYSEAFTILYKENHFYFNNAKHRMLLPGDLYARQAFARIKHIHLIFEILIQGIPPVMQYMIDFNCSLETLSLDFEFPSTCPLNIDEWLRLQWEQVEEEFATESHKTTLANVRFRELVATLAIQKSLEISVRSNREKWRKPFEEFAAAIGKAKGWSSVLTNSEILSEGEKNQHSAGVTEINTHIFDTYSGIPKGTWKRTWTLKPIGPDQR